MVVAYSQRGRPPERKTVTEYGRINQPKKRFKMDEKSRMPGREEGRKEGRQRDRERQRERDRDREIN